MTQTLNAKIAASYLGCEAKVRETPYSKSRYGTLCGVELDRIWIVNKENTSMWASMEKCECQLILTPLSEITDEEIYEAYKTMETAEHEPDFSKENFLDKMSPVRCAEDCERYGQSCYYSAIDYLRSSKWNGRIKPAYDMGYGSIPSLIEARIAVKKTK